MSNQTLNAEADEVAAVSSLPVIRECDVCGTVMLDLHCKLRCTNCGFMRDCSDP